MFDDHAVQQGANRVETAHVQTCGTGNTARLHTKNHRTKIVSRKLFTNLRKHSANVLNQTLEHVYLGGFGIQ